MCIVVSYCGEDAASDGQRPTLRNLAWIIHLYDTDFMLRKDLIENYESSASASVRIFFTDIVRRNTLLSIFSDLVGFRFDCLLWRF